MITNEWISKILLHLSTASIAHLQCHTKKRKIHEWNWLNIFQWELNNRSSQNRRIFPRNICRYSTTDHLPFELCWWMNVLEVMLQCYLRWLLEFSWILDIVHRHPKAYISVKKAKASWFMRDQQNVLFRQKNPKYLFDIYLANLKLLESWYDENATFIFLSTIYFFFFMM